MAINISDLLGPMYNSIDEARIDASPGEVIVTDNDEAFYIVSREVFSDIQPFDYRIVG
ncbi:hypothetical protein G3A_06995 [Bacillus sp. 17376]|nr:hypothetical protein G3A_06995 [Bacillus sp. 17376]